MSDPKARVVEIISAALLESGAHPWPKYLHDLVSDRLAYADLLASAPVVPSLAELREVYRKAISNAREDHAGAGIEAIRNHLLTIGYKAPS